MSSRLALINCRGPYEGVWAHSKGNEYGIEIFDLGEGAFVRFEWKHNGSTEFMDFYQIGEFPLPRIEFKQYRVSKQGRSDRPTIVRVLLNGQS